MKDKICPFMSRPKPWETSTMNDTTNKIEIGLHHSVLMVPCHREQCQAWYLAGEYCQLINPRGIDE